MLGLMTVAACTAAMAQHSSVLGAEPSPRVLGAVLYPGSVFIRITRDMSETYDTAMYISLMPFENVESFFNRMLAQRRKVTYEDDETFLTAYLLKTRSEFPDSPGRDDLDGLYREPSVQLQVYDPDTYETLARYYDNRMGGRLIANALRRARTMILYTYERTAAPTYADRAIGTWIEVSRDLPQYFGARLTLNEDGTYTYFATPENIAAFAANAPEDADYCQMDESECTVLISDRNPETGSYAINGNAIWLSTDAAIDGDNRKSGLIEIGSVTMRLELIDKPRLTFVNFPNRDRRPGISDPRRMTPPADPFSSHTPQ